MKNIEIKIEDIKITRNIRTELGDLSELMLSIRENGLLQPLGICKINEEYILVYGHRRFSALKKLGRKTLELGKEFIIVERNSAEDLLILNIVENFHREDNSPLEFAKAASDLKEMGLTTSEIAVRLSASKHKIFTALKLLSNVPQEYRKDISYGGSGRGDKKGKLPANVASAIADYKGRYNLNKEDIDKLYEEAREQEFSSRDIRLITLGLIDGLKFEVAIKLPLKYKNKQINLVVDSEEVEKLKIPFNTYVINCLKGKENFNRQLFY